MNVIEIRWSNMWFRRGCVLCGGETNKDGVFAVLEHGEDELAVCDRCVEAGPDLIGQRIVGHAERLERQADELRRVAEEPFEMPTLEALQDARALREVEYEMEADR